MEVSIANRAHSSQARRDSSRTNRILPRQPKTPTKPERKRERDQRRERKMIKEKEKEMTEEQR
jgi:hypothetical protein